MIDENALSGNQRPQTEHIHFERYRVLCPTRMNTSVGSKAFTCMIRLDAPAAFVEAGGVWPLAGGVRGLAGG